MDTQLDQIEAIFNEALEKPSGEERPRFLGQASGVDTELRQRVESLLASFDAAQGRFMNVPLQDPTITAVLREGPGMRIGRYRLLEKIGEGGFGVVFMVEQEELVRKKWP